MSKIYYHLLAVHRLSSFKLGHGHQGLTLRHLQSGLVAFSTHQKLGLYWNQLIPET